MLLRRGIDHMKTEDRFAVGLDFIIVVAGIFVGLQVDDFVQIMDLGDEIFAPRFLASADSGL